MSQYCFWTFEKNWCCWFCRLTVSLLYCVFQKYNSQGGTNTEHIKALKVVLLLPERLCLFVCFFVSRQDYTKTPVQISKKLGGRTGHLKVVSYRVASSQMRRPSSTGH